ncbi:MAG TPA: MlaD family protein [Solirubrobacteraceae bacterium]
MKRILLSAAILLAAGAFIFLAGGASNQSAAGTYKIELDNAFGLIAGADFKVGGVPAGTIKSIDLDTKTLHAVVNVQVTSSGFGQFHKDAFCKSRPQSLIGEYYIDCDPGTRSSPILKPGATIPVSHTFSTIPADLLQDVMRMPYRQRFTLIINELGAAAAARSGDLQAALQRAVPALTETDNLLNLLGNDSTTIQNLTRDSNSVITALANNSSNVKRFIDEANRTSTATATQQQNLRLTFQKLPPLLEQLKPALAKLDTTVATNTPVLQNLHAASGQIDRLLTDLPPFSHSAVPAIKSLGQASVTGKVAVKAATPTVADLNKFAKPTPELAQNLSIVLNDLDTQSRAVEPDSRSPGGVGFSGLQALLGYVFNQTLAINYYGPLGHVLGVDAFVSTMCSNYATPATIAMAIKQYGPRYRQCYSWLGPNQPAVNETDPSDPSAPVPDPGGAPPGQRGPSTSAARMVADVTRKGSATTTGSHVSNTRGTTATTPATTTASPNPSSGSSTTSTSTSTAATQGTTPGTTSTTSGGPPINLKKTVGQILAGIGGAPAGSGSGAGSQSSSSGSPSQAQALLNYLMTP